MTFVKVLAHAAILPAMILAPLADSILAQDDFIENEGAAPDTGGLFDQDLEPLDENPPRAEMPKEMNFPPAKKVQTTPGKSLPELPNSIVPKSNEKLRMDFVQVEIEEVVKYFAERLKKKFVYDSSTLTGKITVISPTEVTLREAWGAFLSALEVRGYIVYPSSDKADAYLKLEKAENARKAPVPVLEGTTPSDDSYVTRIVPLKYLQANDIQTAIRSLLSRRGGDVIVHPATNTLIISDYAHNIRRMIRILNILDVEGFQEQIEIITLRNASAQDIAKKISDFFPTGSAAISGAPSSRARRGGGDGVIQKVVADERTNSIIVLGSERGIEQVKRFVSRIDVPTESGGGRIHVYPVQNVKAKDIAATLSSLTAGNKDRRNIPPNFPPNFPPNSSGEPDVATIGDVKITADEATNSLVIQSSPRDFDVLKSIIRKLDIRRRQVFIEGAILEASVSKGSNFSLQAAGPLAQTAMLKGSSTSNSGIVGTLNGIGFDSLLTGAATSKALTGMALGFRSGGNYEVKYKEANGTEKTVSLPLLSAVLQLSAVNTGVNVLSTPHILATANEEASIVIGNEVPQIGGTERTSGGNVTNNITRMKIATELKIKPQINAGDYLTLAIEQKIDDAGEKFPEGISTIKREVKTTVIIKDQQTVVIGGLMRDRKRTVVSKVPFLGDIPILGWLFKSRSTDSEKVNLIVFLTPYIIRNTGDMNDQFFRKLKEREGFLKDIGVAEMKGVPSSGLTENQLKLLDPEYVKSLEQRVLSPEAKTPVSAEDQEDHNLLEAPEPKNIGQKPAKKIEPTQQNSGTFGSSPAIPSLSDEAPKESLTPAAGNSSETVKPPDEAKPTESAAPAEQQKIFVPRSDPGPSTPSIPAPIMGDNPAPTPNFPPPMGSDSGLDFNTMPPPPPPFPGGGAPQDLIIDDFPAQ